MARIVAVPPVVVDPCNASFRPCLTVPTTRPRTSTCVAKAHFGFRRVDVDVDFARVALEEQGGDRVPVGRQEIEIGARAARRRRLVAHRPSIDEQELWEAFGRLKVGRPDPAGKPRAFAAQSSPTDSRRSRRQGLAQPLGGARFALSRGRPVTSDIGRERKRGCGTAMARRLTASAAAALTPVGLEELEPGRGGGEEIARLDPRAERRG